MDPIPTGNDTEAAQRYFNYLYEQYYQDIPMNRATEILTSGPVLILFWALVLIVFFLLYARYFNNVHRSHDELYGAASFAGSLLERNGKVSVFTVAVIVFLFAGSLYLAIRDIINGYIY